RTSPLWKRTFLRILNSHTVSESAFQDVASEGSNCSLVDRCSRESNMLMLTRIPTRSKCMWGSRVGAWDTSAAVSVALAGAAARGGMGAGASGARTRAAASGAHRFMRVSSSGHGDRGVERGRWPQGVRSVYHRAPPAHNPASPSPLWGEGRVRGSGEGDQAEG